MSFSARTLYRTGNNKLRSQIESVAQACGVTLTIRTSGWILKDMVIEAFGHKADLDRFESMCPKGVHCD